MTSLRRSLEPRLARCMGRLAERLERAGAPVGPAGFLALAAAGGLVAAALAGAVARTPIAALLAAGAVCLAARGYLASADRRYLGRIAGQVPGVAQQMAGALSAGVSLYQAIARAGADAPEPAASELRRVAADLGLGARVDEALAALIARVPDPGLAIMVTAILVQRRSGGNLAGALADLAGRLEDRARLAKEVAGASAQARASAWIVVALPLAGGMLVEASSPGTLARTLGHGPGLALLAVSLAIQAAGALVIRRLVRIEV
jgi:tight adherence protein B